MKSMIKNEHAVSPVVGVMLMLVVTIIIAAVVSGFAGGLISGTEKSPQASIKADYSRSTGLTISHMGGDAINTLQTGIVVQPTADFGGYDQLSWEVNTSVVMINKDGVNKPWFDSSKYASALARTFQPGEVAVVSVDDLGQVQPKTYTTTANPTGDSGSGYYGFNNNNALGQRFILSLVDDAGRTIAKTEVQIRP
jgi:FlaG/FlaF family flagellin (archaellin)